MSLTPQDGAPHATVVPLAPHHAPAAAKLHLQGQPDAFLTRMGQGALTCIYCALPRAGFGFAAVDPDTQSVRGFVSGAHGLGPVARALAFMHGGRKALRFAGHIGKAGLRDPALLLRAVETLAYPLRTAKAPRHAGFGHSVQPFELLSIMVDAEYRSTGIGSKLLAAFEAECRARRYAAIKVTVEAANARARNFYARHGYEPINEFALYGRSMVLYGKLTP